MRFAGPRRVRGLHGVRGAHGALCFQRKGAVEYAKVPHKGELFLLLVDPAIRPFERL